MKFTFPEGSFRPLVLCHLWDSYAILISVASLCAALPQLVKRKISYKIRLLQYGEQFWGGFQGTEANCKILVPTEHFALEKNYWPWLKRPKLEKASVAFHSKNTIGACFILLCGVCFASMKLQAYFLRHLWECYVGPLTLILLCAASPNVNRANFPTTWGFYRKENNCWVGFKLLKPTANT